ncbi:CoF synthetase [Paenibacillus sepulcri]
MRNESAGIVQEILAFMERFGDRSAAESGEPALEEAYNKLALQLFQYQFQYNIPYRKYCQARRKSPLNVREWREIPPLPIQGFKELTLSCEPPEEAEAVFMTSGTTNADKKGRNYHPTLQVWDKSMALSFAEFVLPDTQRMTTWVISPGSDLNPNSSLSRYVSRAVELYGSEDSRNFYHAGSGLDMEGLASAMQAVQGRVEPVLILGTTFSYVHFLDYCQERSLQFTLPAGSIVFDTGGLKGQAREVTVEELHQAFTAAFCLDRSRFVNMYGMTELSSQLYDRTVSSSVSDAQSMYVKSGPAWIRTLVLDPDTLEPVSQGESGVLAHFDLANWNSSLAILTEDTGCMTDRGLMLEGRLQGSEARGCSIAVDQLKQAAWNG